MFKDGKVDHEAPQHARYKMDLSAKAEAALREELQAEAANNMSAAAAATPQAAVTTSHSSAAINGL